MAPIPTPKGAAGGGKGSGVKGGGASEHETFTQVDIIILSLVFGSVFLYLSFYCCLIPIYYKYKMLHAMEGRRKNQIEQEAAPGTSVALGNIPSPMLAAPTALGDFSHSQTTSGEGYYPTVPARVLTRASPAAEAQGHDSSPPPYGQYTGTTYDWNAPKQ